MPNAVSQSANLRMGIALRAVFQSEAWLGAHADPGLKVAAKASGAVCLLQKPFAMDALIDCLEQRSNF